MDLDINLCRKLYNEFNKRKCTYKKMKNYYMGETDGIKNYPKTDRSNRTVNTNYIKKFINEETSFAVGNPISYISRETNQELISDIEFIMSGQKGSIDSELMQTMLIFGTAYEIYYLMNAEFKSKVVDPLSGIAYCNNEGQSELFLYFYKRELDDTTYIDIYDENYIYHYNESFNEVIPPTKHYFGCCPVGVSKLTDEIYSTLYNDIKSLQDNYELVLSDYSNEISDTRMSYMVINGLELEEEDARKMKELGIIQTKATDGKVEWLIKNINSDFIKSYIEILEDKIYQISHHINHNIAMSSNVSGVALQSRLISLRNKIGMNQQCLTDCIKTRIKCLITFLNITYDKKYDYRDIAIKYTMNVPSDDVAIAQMITQLNGKLSAETGLNQLSFITNGRAEYERALKEQRALLEDQVDLDGVDENA